MKATQRPFRRRWPKPAVASHPWVRILTTTKLPSRSARRATGGVTDKGYHSRAVVSELAEWACARTARSRIPGGRAWTTSGACQRRRIRGERRLRLLRQRGEKLERWNQHLYDRAGMRRVHLRGRDSILKRLVVHSGAANLGLLMRKLFDKGTPRGLAAALPGMISAAEASTRLWSLTAILIRKVDDSLARARSPQMISVGT